MPGGEKKAVIDGKELLPNPNVPERGVGPLGRRSPRRRSPNGARAR